TKFGGFRRTGVAQRRQERRSDGTEDGTSQVPPGTKYDINKDVDWTGQKRRRWTVRWKEVLGLPECPYVYRWRFETPFGSIREHHAIVNDDARHLHDHPWPFVTFILRGSYHERIPGGWNTLKAPSVHYRPANYQHAVFPDTSAGPVWTEIVTGPRVRSW